MNDAGLLGNQKRQLNQIACLIIKNAFLNIVRITVALYQAKVKQIRQLPIG